ncbi:MAG TPA: M43 family zinc metalloprotease [Patescibacteria group bacterium]|nr:M43 family zinc metalloprotease [Patescibacteria group bacterium]
MATFLKKIYLSVIIIFCCLQIANAQLHGEHYPVTGCGFDAVHQSFLRNSAEAMLIHKKTEAAIEVISGILAQKSGYAEGRRQEEVLISVPVVIHVIHNGGPENISDEQIKQGLQDLNDAFKNNGLFYSEAGVNVGIEFCLAQQDENGAFTTGVNRFRSGFTNVTLETQDLTLKALSRWDPLKYINIWIVKEVVSTSAGTGVSGYAYYPSSHGRPSDGIVIESKYFGTSDDNSKVIIHEAGHYLGLYHTFEGGCGNNNCLQDGDKVCDTPPDASTALYQCSVPVNTCTTDVDDRSANNPFRSDQNDLITNYMDYGDARCQTAFTQGQKERMIAVLLTTRKSLLESKACQSVCKKVITAGFTVPAGTMQVQQPIFIVNTTTGASRYEWYIDDQLMFNTRDIAQISFAEEGRHTIRLVASNDEEACTKETKKTIDIVCPVTASFTASKKSIMPGDYVVFKNFSSGAASYVWMIDGVETKTTNDFDYTFVNAGTYSVGLIARGQLCSDTAYITIRVGTCISKRGNIWQFGNGAGLDFTLDTPKEIPGMLTKESWEGCSSICDRDGKLLFATDGKTVWTASGSIMPDGTGLMGRSSAAQSSLIVPMPESEHLYYIFTVDGWEASPEPLSQGLRYTVIDMRLNNGRGAVIRDQKNILLHTPVTEQLGGVMHCNGKDVWVMTHDWGSDEFLAYLVTKNGVTISPVVSKIGAEYKPIQGEFPLSHSIATLKFAHHGRKLAAGLYQRDIMQLFDFNNTTGILTNPQTYSIRNAYGLEFSPDISKLYVSSFDDRSIYQVVLGKNTLTDTIRVIWSEKSGANTGGSLQLAPNGKIYYAGGRGFGGNTRYARRLGVINAPNESGILCGYNDVGIVLNGGQNNSGLPNFVQSIFFEGKPELTGPTELCAGAENITYSAASLECTSETSFQWEFKGDLVVKEQNGNIVRVSFSKPGEYKVIVKKTGRCGESRDTLTVGVFTPKMLSLGNDISLCLGSQIKISADTGFVSYEWQNGFKGRTLTITEPGMYWVRATSKGGCVSMDTIQVFKASNAPVLTISDRDTMEFCNGSVALLQAADGFREYRWQDGFDGRVYTAFAPGKYSVIATDFCGRTYASSIYLQQTFKTITTNENSTICPGDSIQLFANTDEQVVWSPFDGLSDPFSKTPYAKPGSTTTYTVSTLGSKCRANGLVTVSVAEKLPLSFHFQSHVAEPGVKGLSIPVITKTPGPLPFTLKNVVVEMEYDPSILQPASATRGNLSVVSRFGKHFIRIHFASMTISRPEQTAFYIYADVLAGDTTLMPLVFENIMLDNGCIEIANRGSGQLTVTTCNIDQRQAEFNEQVYISLLPNPAGNETELTVSIMESGNHTIGMYDVLGKKVWEEKFNSVNLPFSKKIQLNLLAFPEGSYQVVLQTPTITRSARLNIVR